MELSVIINNKKIYEKSFTKMDILKVLVIIIAIGSNPAFKTIPNIMKV